MRVRRAILTLGLALSWLGAAAAPAAAGPEWCDEGSPPPNDFRFRRTGAPSAGSSTSWLRSTTSGALDLSAGTNTLEGGVAKGMRTALAHAPAAKAQAPAAEDDRSPRSEHRRDD